jgi:hypothetical protein
MFPTCFQHVEAHRQESGIRHGWRLGGKSAWETSQGATGSHTDGNMPFCLQSFCLQASCLLVNSHFIYACHAIRHTIYPLHTHKHTHIDTHTHTYTHTHTHTMSRRLDVTQGDQNIIRIWPILWKVAKTVAEPKIAKMFTSKPNLKLKNT